LGIASALCAGCGGVRCAESVLHAAVRMRRARVDPTRLKWAVALAGSACLKLLGCRHVGTSDRLRRQVCVRFLALNLRAIKFRTLKFKNIQ
jgi:hypothetical protein